MPKYILMLALALLLGSLAAQTATIQESYLAEARGDYQNALRIMQSLSSGEPNDTFYQMRKAWLNYLLGSYQEALADYQAAANKLNHLDAHLGEINCYLALGNWDQAKVVADRLLQVHAQNPSLLSKAAYALYMKRDYAGAASYFERIMAIYPWDFENLGYLVNNLYLAGRVDDARAAYRVLKKYYPQSQIVIDYSSLLDQ